MNIFLTECRIVFIDDNMHFTRYDHPMFHFAAKQNKIGSRFKINMISHKSFNYLSVRSLFGTVINFILLCGKF